MTIHERRQLPRLAVVEARSQAKQTGPPIRSTLPCSSPRSTTDSRLVPRAEVGPVRLPADSQVPSIMVVRSRTVRAGSGMTRRGGRPRDWQAIGGGPVRPVQRQDRRRELPRLRPGDAPGPLRVLGGATAAYLVQAAAAGPVGPAACWPVVTPPRDMRPLIHGVVARLLAVAVVVATAGVDAAVRRALLDIEQAGRGVLREVRWLVGVLRDRPVHRTMSDLAALADAGRNAGFAVRPAMDWIASTPVGQYGSAHQTKIQLRADFLAGSSIGSCRRMA